MARLLVLHGPNLNLLGSREPMLYGNTPLTAIDQALKLEAEALGHQIQSIQSNAEDKLVDAIQSAKKFNVDCILINPAAFTHTSIAIRDALLAVQIPTIEVHLTIPEAREPFRHTSLIADIVIGRIQGFGAFSYELALSAAHQFLQTQLLNEETR
ncbi:MAG TPA: type II 3-dehydroquinate dehydratase [Coxiellaceae bacterium]|nr:type II 3-dehydroquinate dehydratase [Coxiellaceae bacterium]